MTKRRNLPWTAPRRDFLKAVGAGAALGLLGPAGRLAPADEPTAPTQKPNIVYVFPDQMREFSWPGGGDGQVLTPSLEAFAREGASFNHCISNHPLCSPYRASLLTGRYQQANTVGTNVGARGGLPTSEITIADVLKKAGYATGYVGKWHLYPGSREGTPVPPGPHRHGFDYWRAGFNYRDRYHTKYYDDSGRAVLLEGYGPSRQMDQTIEFIEKNAGRPFCVFLSWHPPHPPYAQAPKRFVDLYSADKIRLRPNVPAGEARQARQNAVEYFSHISALDAELGRLMDKLRKLGIADNTIVCFSSDHGDMLGSFGRYGKNVPWEEAIRVPFLIRWPGGIPGGRRLDTLLATVDIAPTLLGLAGVAAPEAMQGSDLSAILRGKDAPGPESVFIMGNAGGAAEGEAPAGKGKNKRGGKKAGNGGNWEGVRTPHYTYAERGRKLWLLYDNDADPFQQHNLADEASHEAKRKELAALLEQWSRRVGEA